MKRINFIEKRCSAPRRKQVVARVKAQLRKFFTGIYVFVGTDWRVDNAWKFIPICSKALFDGEFPVIYDNCGTIETSPKAGVCFIDGKLKVGRPSTYGFFDRPMVLDWYSHVPEGRSNYFHNDAELDICLAEVNKNKFIESLLADFNDEYANLPVYEAVNSFYKKARKEGRI